MAWTNDILDESTRITLNHLSSFRPRLKHRDIVITTNYYDLSSHGNILGVVDAIYPYNSHGYPIKHVDVIFKIDDGIPYVYINHEVDDTSTIRLVTVIPHELNGLDSASSTSFTTEEESLIVLGAAGYACLSRSIALNETSVSRTTSTPNYGTLSELLLGRFENGFSMAKK